MSGSERGFTDERILQMLGMNIALENESQNHYWAQRDGILIERKLLPPI